MNEQRQEAYLNLIQSLLSCPSGEESQILNAHQNLIDAGLVEALAQVTEVLQERGDQNAANFLDDLAHQLVEALGLRSFGSSLTTDCEPQLTFLKQVLQITADGSPQTLYQLLQGNLDQLNDNFVTLLREWAATTVSDLKEGLEIAPIIGNFSSLITIWGKLIVTGFTKIKLRTWKPRSLVFQPPYKSTAVKLSQKTGLWFITVWGLVT